MDAHPDALVSPPAPPVEPPAGPPAGSPAGSPARRGRRRMRTTVEVPVDAASATAPASVAAAADVVEDAERGPATPGRFSVWFRSRPTIGGLITVLGGVAMFFSSQLQVGGMTVHVGIEGAQAMILPAVLIVCGALAIFSPAQHLFYGIVAMIIAVYSLVGVNLGGFFIGFLLGSAGGVIVASWRRKDRAADDADGSAPDAPALEGLAPAPAGERE